MEIIADTSVIMAVVLNEPEKPRIIELTVDCKIIAPKSVFWEVGNALSAMLKRKRLRFDEVTNAIEAFQQIPISYVDVELKRALTIAHEKNLYAYDAYLITCA